jgi:hypothetical protein
VAQHGTDVRPALNWLDDFFELDDDGEDSVLVLIALGICDD